MEMTGAHLGRGLCVEGSKVYIMEYLDRIILNVANMAIFTF